MRDLILLTVIVVALPFCVYRPWIGILVWSWLGYMNPHRLAWDFAYDYPFAQTVAAATLIGFSWYVVRGRGLRGFLEGSELKLLLLLWFIYTYTTALALVPVDAWEAWNQISKILLMVFLTAFLIDDEKKLRYLMLVITFSIGFYGVKGGAFSVLTGGQYRVWGPANSFIEDNNALALALNMTLPFLYYLGQTEKQVWLRRILFISFGFSILAVLFTYSRGGFLGLAVVLGSIFLTTRFRWKIILATTAAISFPIVISQLPGQWIDRIQSIGSYEQDGSALSRIEAWRSAWNLAIDRPLTGGGFNALNTQEIFFRYNPEMLENIAEQSELGVHASGVHSIYFELLAENGFPGLIVFLTLCIVLLLNQRKLTNRKADTDSSTRIAYGRILAISLLAYLVSGTFLEMGSFDLFYQIVALTVVANRIYSRNRADPEHIQKSKLQVDNSRTVKT